MKSSIYVKRILNKLKLSVLYSKIKFFYQNNPASVYVIIFFIILLTLNNIILNSKRINIEKYPDYFIFPGFFDLEKKYSYQKRIFNSLKRLDKVNFYIHTVVQGENYWGIAKENNINIDTIIGVNPYLNNLYAAEDEKLIVCDRSGCLHILQKGETIASIAELYQVPARDIKKVNNRNVFKDIFFPLKQGQVLFIPKGVPRFLTRTMKEFYEKRRALQSPLGGRYTSAFGTRIHPVYKRRKFHYGLDIKARVGQPVGAANSGIVTFAGWASGYGKYIKVQHYNGYMTSYGHLSRIHVKTGQKVSQGQIIGRAGNTGTSTGPHLDFRVWYKGKPVDPAQFLW